MGALVKGATPKDATAVAARYVALEAKAGEDDRCRVEHTPSDIDAEYVQIRDDPRRGSSSRVRRRRRRLVPCLDHDRTGPSRSAAGCCLACDG